MGAHRDATTPATIHSRRCKPLKIVGGRATMATFTRTSTDRIPTGTTTETITISGVVDATETTTDSTTTTDTVTIIIRKSTIIIGKIINNVSTTNLNY